MELQKANLPEDDPDTMKCMGNLAANYGRQGRLDKFKPLVLQTLEIQKRVFGEMHELTLVSKGLLTNAYMMEGQLDEAITLIQDILEIATRLYGADHPYTLIAVANLAVAYYQADDLKKTIELLQPSLPVMRRVWADQSSFHTSLSILAFSYVESGRLNDGRPLLIELLTLLEPRVDRSDTSVETLDMAALALMQKVEGIQNSEKALEYAQRACQLVNASSTERPRYLRTFARAQHQTGDTAAAVDTMRRALALMPPAHQMRPKLDKELAAYEAALAEAGKESPSETPAHDSPKGESDKAPPATRDD